MRTKEDTPTRIQVSQSAFRLIKEEMEQEGGAGATEKQEKGSAAEKYTCRFCRKTERYKSLLLSHEKLHDQAKFFCKFKDCDRVYKWKSDLKKHERTHRSKPFSCTWANCTMNFGTNRDLMTHTYVAHEGRKMFKCDMCSTRAFLWRNSLTKHMRKHHPEGGEQRWRCVWPGCSRRRGFQSKRNLETHLKAHKKGVKLHGCEDCGKEYIWPSSLANHRRNIHNDFGKKEKSVMINSGRDQDQKNLQKFNALEQLIYVAERVLVPGLSADELETRDGLCHTIAQRRQSLLRTEKQPPSFTPFKSDGPFDQRVGMVFMMVERSAA